MSSGNGFVNVALVSHGVSSSNLGVGALTLAHLTILESAAARADVGVHVSIVGSRGSLGYGPHDVPFEYLSFKEMLVAEASRRVAFTGVRTADIVLDIGEGDSFTDIYGWKRFMTLWLSKRNTLRRAVPLVLSPQTVGPFEGRLSARLARATLESAHVVFGRDSVSVRYVRDLSASVVVEETADVAMALPYDNPVRRSGRVAIGMNVSGLLYSSDAPVALRSDYVAVVHELLDRFTEDPEMDVHLVPHVFAPGATDDDEAVCRDLQRRYGSVHLPDRFASPSAAKSYIAGLDVFVGARMHACIAALSSGVATVPIAYSRKATGYFGGLGYHYTVNAASETTEAVVAGVLRGVERRDELAASAASVQTLAMERLATYEDTLVELLSGVA